MSEAVPHPSPSLLTRKDPWQHLHPESEVVARVDVKRPATGHLRRFAKYFSQRPAPPSVAIALAAERNVILV